MKEQTIEIRVDFKPMEVSYSLREINSRLYEKEYHVIYEGEAVGRVHRYRRTMGHKARGSRIIHRTTSATKWYGRTNGHYSISIERDTRKAAVADVLKTVMAR